MSSYSEFNGRIVKPSKLKGHKVVIPEEADKLRRAGYVALRADIFYNKVRSCRDIQYEGLIEIVAVAGNTPETRRPHNITLWEGKIQSTSPETYAREAKRLLTCEEFVQGLTSQYKS